MKTGLIYRVTNIINGKYYIGQTVQGLSKRRASHTSASSNKKVKHYNCHFYKAIRKYGPESFTWEVLAEDIPLERLDLGEILAIYIYDSFGPKGYNSDTGGNSGKIVSEEVKKKHSVRWLKDKNPNFGKSLPSEQKEKMIASLKGRHLSPASEWTKGTIPWNKGLNYTKERRERMSDLNKGKHYSPTTEYKSGKDNPWFGKKRGPMSAEAKQKMIETKKKNRHLKQQLVD